MTISIGQKGTHDLADNLCSFIKACHAACQRAQVENNNNTYQTVMDIPAFNKRLRDHITLIQNSGQVSKVVAKLNDLLINDVTLTDVQNFATAFDLLANDIEANDTLFIATINADSKQPEFVTPVSEEIKAAINSRIEAVLAEVS